MKHPPPFETYRLPDYYACYAMYGDSEGLTNEEIQAYNDFIDAHYLGSCASIGDVTISTAHNDMRTGLYCDCLDYTFYVKESQK
jgi:hypothetical protein